MELNPVVVSPTATGKQSKVSSSTVDDILISSLPDDLVCHIISFLPLKEAVKTSTLSTRWRHIHKSISTLNMKQPCDDDLESYLMICDPFMDFVDRVLGTWRNRIVRKVSIECHGYALRERVESWILGALDNQVRELDLSLKIVGEAPIELPIGLFTCNTLQVLRLILNHYVVLDFPPRCFPYLKSLHLSLRFLLSGHDSLERFFSSFSVLEELVIHRLFLESTSEENQTTRSSCKFNLFNHTLKRLTIEYVDGFDKDHGINIQAPSLVYFECHQPSKVVLKNLISLVQVHIHCGSISSCDADSPPALLAYYSTVIQIFQGIKHAAAQSLRISGNFGAVFLQGSSIRSGPIPIPIPIPKLPKLTYLHLELFAGWGAVVPDLLQCFPCLEALHFEVDLRLRYSKATRVTLPSKILPSSIWSRLKTLTFLSFEGNKYDLKMAKHFMKNAQLLEIFIVKFATEEYLTLKRRSKITKTLLKLPKLSKHCKILVV